LNSEGFIPFLSGAGGYWPVIDEVASLSVIQQQDRFSCGPACAEMVLRDLGIDNVTQALIAKNTQTPVRLSDLAQTLNQFEVKGLRRWVGGGFDLSEATVAELLATLISTGAWIAELREPMARLGHLVVVDGFNENSLLLIRDPWQGTRYKMEQEAFLNYWTRRGIYAISL
jgi:filamentous hemagglutinin